MFKRLSLPGLPEVFCEILTHKDVAPIDKVASLRGTLPMISSIGQKARSVHHVSSPLPRWDAEYRTLYVGQRVVKQYRVPSRNQETILAAFQEEGWPRHIDDPLPPRGDIDPKCRLHDTIKRLNRHHKHRLIRFRGNGDGEGVCWEYMDGVAHASDDGAEQERKLLYAE